MRNSSFAAADDRSSNKSQQLKEVDHEPVHAIHHRLLTITLREAAIQFVKPNHSIAISLGEMKEFRCSVLVLLRPCHTHIELNTRIPDGTGACIEQAVSSIAPGKLANGSVMFMPPLQEYLHRYESPLVMLLVHLMALAWQQAVSPHDTHQGGHYGSSSAASAQS